MASELKKAKDRKYHQENKAKRNEAKRLWRMNNLTKEQDRHFRRRYGIGRENYLDMLYAQDSCCAICGHSPDEALIVEHSHINGKVRALCCTLCNTMLGFSRDNPAILLKGATYLKQYENN